MIVKVEVKSTQWACGDVEPPLVLAAGVHELESPAPELVRALAAAQAANVVSVVSADARAARMIEKAVEPDEASLELQAAAVGSGAWRRGNLMQRLVECRERLSRASGDPEVAARLNDEIALLESQLPAGGGV